MSIEVRRLSWFELCQLSHTTYPLSFREPVTLYSFPANAAAYRPPATALSSSNRTFPTTTLSFLSSRPERSGEDLSRRAVEDLQCAFRPSQIRPRKRPGLRMPSGSKRLLICRIRGRLSGKVPQQSSFDSTGCLRTISDPPPCSISLAQFHESITIREARNHNPSALYHRLATQPTNPLGKPRNLRRKHRALADKRMRHLQLPRAPHLICSRPRTKPFTLGHRLQRSRLCMQHLGQRRKLHVELEPRRCPAELNRHCTHLGVQQPEHQLAQAAQHPARTR